jgi:hypothetical protein
MKCFCVMCFILASLKLPLFWLANSPLLEYLAATHPSYVLLNLTRFHHLDYLQLYHDLTVSEC